MPGTCPVRRAIRGDSRSDTGNRQRAGPVQPQVRRPRPPPVNAGDHRFWRAACPRTSLPCGGSVAVMPDYDADPQVVPYLLYEDAARRWTG